MRTLAASLLLLTLSARAQTPSPTQCRDGSEPHRLPPCSSFVAVLERLQEERKEQLRQQNYPANPGFRLAYVQRIYIENLGNSDAARVVQDQVAGAILNRTGLRLAGNRSDAHALLTGIALVTSGQLQWALSSASASASQANIASADPNFSASASRATATARASSGSGTYRITELGLQLTDPYGQILWAFDGTRCLDATTLILTGIPKKKPVTVCAAEQLAKAIDKDAKAARSR